MSDLNKLVEKFAQDSGSTWQLSDNGYSGTLTFGPVQVRLALQPGGSMLIVQTGVGIYPEEGGETLAKRLLAANDLFSETHGMTLGLNKAAEVITLQATCDFYSLSQEGFSNLMEHFFAETEHWLRELSEPQSEGTSAPSLKMEQGSQFMWMKM